MFRPPYRWAAAPLNNLRCCWYDFTNGIRQLLRWIPIIWFDADFDWEYLAALMEAKLRWMAADCDRWPTARAELDKRQMLVCAALLKRLRADDYFENAERSMPGPVAAKHAHQMQQSDKLYLGLVLGKHLNYWWG